MPFIVTANIETGKYAVQRKNNFIRVQWKKSEHEAETWFGRATNNKAHRAPNLVHAALESVETEDTRIGGIDLICYIERSTTFWLVRTRVAQHVIKHLTSQPVEWGKPFPLSFAHGARVTTRGERVCTREGVYDCNATRIGTENELRWNTSVLVDCLFVARATRKRLYARERRNEDVKILVTF